MQKHDFCGVDANRDNIIEKTKLERFSKWWERFLEQMKNADQPSLETLSFAYAVTGDEQLGQKAIAQFRKLLPGYIPLGGAKDHYPDLDADLSTASACKTLAYIYSFLYPLLESEDKRKLFSELRERGGGVIYKETLAGAWWGNSPNSNWTSHLHSGLGLAGIVLMEDDEAEAQKWIDTATKTMITMLDLAGEEGAGIEGPGYWGFCYRSVQEMVEALKNIGGSNLYSHRFWQKCVDYPLYMMRPDQSGLMNFSDTGSRGLGPSYFHYAVASATKNGLSQWFGNIIQEQGSPSIWDLLYYDPDVIPKSPDDLPKDKLFRSAHIASFRSGWDKDAVFFILKGGSNAWSHCHLDLNSFFIDAYGERLVVDPGPDQYSIHYFTSIEPALSTSWHNTIVVDGADQRQPPRYRMSFDLEEGGDAYCRLSDFASNDDIAMIKGDATTAYGDYLDKFHRDVIYLKPNCFVVYDNIRLREVRTQRHIQWLLHSELPFSENEDGTITIQGKECKLIIHTILPTNYRHKFLTPRVLMKDKDSGKSINCLSIRPQWYHLWNISPSQSPYPQWDARSKGVLYGRDVQFLVVLTVLRNDQPYNLKIEPIKMGNADGVEIVNGDMTDRVYFKTLPNDSMLEKNAVIRRSKNSNSSRLS
ncbi:MAG: heparinase II/III family protein [Candidatus Poribacteria bacterium]